MTLQELYSEKFAAQKSESNLKQGLKPKLIVTVDNNSKPFIGRLDHVLQRISGFDKVEIVALNSMKDAQTIKSMGIPTPGVLFLSGGKPIASMGPTSENDLNKFFQSLKKYY